MEAPQVVRLAQVVQSGEKLALAGKVLKIETGFMDAFLPEAAGSDGEKAKIQEQDKPRRGMEISIEYVPATCTHFNLFCLGSTPGGAARLPRTTHNPAQICPPSEYGWGRGLQGFRSP